MQLRRRQLRSDTAQTSTIIPANHDTRTPSRSQSRSASASASPEKSGSALTPESAKSETSLNKRKLAAVDADPLDYEEPPQKRSRSPGLDSIITDPEEAVDILVKTEVKGRLRRNLLPLSIPESLSSQPNSRPHSPSLRGRGKGHRGRGRAGRGNGRGRPRLEKAEAEAKSSSAPSTSALLSGDDQKAYIASVKARQGELKKWFSTLSRHQAELLDQLSMQSLSRLTKKPKAHKKVREYEDVITALQSRRDSAQADIQNLYEAEIENLNTRHEMEKDLVQQQLYVSFRGGGNLI